MKTIILLLACGYLTGCAGSEVASTFIDEAGDTVPYIADASVLKEQAVHKSIRNYQDNMAVMYEQSGFNMAFGMTEINGQPVMMPQLITFRPEPMMVAPPTKPSDHPVWGTINTAIKTITPYGAGYLAVDSIVGGFKSLGSNSGTHYNGPVQMSGSHNTSGGDQTINTAEMKMDQGHRENSPGCSNGNCGGEEEIPAGGTLEDCLANPPGGFSESGTAMYNETLSCGSYFEI